MSYAYSHTHQFVELMADLLIDDNRTNSRLPYIEIRFDDIPHSAHTISIARIGLGEGLETKKMGVKESARDQINHPRRSEKLHSWSAKSPDSTEPA